MAKPKLTKRQKDFADEYIKTGNAHGSAIKAGYSPKYARARSHMLLENVGIGEYLSTRLAKVDSKALKSQVDVHSVVNGIINSGATIDYTVIEKKRKKYITEIDGINVEITEESEPMPIDKLLKALELKAKLDNLFKSDEDEEDYEVVRIVDDIE